MVGNCDASKAAGAIGLDHFFGRIQSVRKIGVNMEGAFHGLSRAGQSCLECALRHGEPVSRLERHIRDFALLDF